MALPPRVRRLAVLVVALALAAASGAGPVAGQPENPSDPVSVNVLLSDPWRYNDTRVSVEGVTGAAQLRQVTVLGNPPYQDVVPMFLLMDGRAGVWVVAMPVGSVRAGGRAPSVPPEGTRAQVHGRFRAGSLAIEMDQLVVR
jgi:hypothetical protein